MRFKHDKKMTFLLRKYVILLTDNRCRMVRVFHFLEGGLREYLANNYHQFNDSQIYPFYYLRG